VKPAQVKLVPLAANTATCEAGTVLGGVYRWARACLLAATACMCWLPPAARYMPALNCPSYFAISCLPPHPAPTAPLLTAQDVGRTISDYAAKANADAVVIGSRGLGAFRRRMLVSSDCVAKPLGPAIVPPGCLAAAL